MVSCIILGVLIVLSMLLALRYEDPHHTFILGLNKTLSRRLNHRVD